MQSLFIYLKWTCMLKSSKTPIISLLHIKRGELYGDIICYLIFISKMFIISGFYLTNTWKYVRLVLTYFLNIEDFQHNFGRFFPFKIIWLMLLFCIRFYESIFKNPSLEYVMQKFHLSLWNSMFSHYYFIHGHTDGWKLKFKRKQIGSTKFDTIPGINVVWCSICSKLILPS